MLLYAYKSVCVVCECILIKSCVRVMKTGRKTRERKRYIAGIKQIRG